MRFPRSSGILLHPTSLPGPYGCGDLGDVSRHFIEWLVVGGQKIWQVLPLEPTGYGYSPYMALSAFAGNPLLIGMEGLLAKGWLVQNDLAPIPAFDLHRINYPQVINYRMQALRRAAERFFSRHRAIDESDFDSFCEEQEDWLEDFALFKALGEHFKGVLWTEWDRDLAQRKVKALERVRTELSGELRFWKFTQWQFYRQWAEVKKYANDRGIKIIGDIPIFVAYQSQMSGRTPNSFSSTRVGGPQLSLAFRPTTSARQGNDGGIHSIVGAKWKRRDSIGGSSVSDGRFFSSISLGSIISGDL